MGYTNTFSFHSFFIFLKKKIFISICLFFFQPPKFLYYLWVLNPRGLGLFDCNCMHAISKDPNNSPLHSGIGLEWVAILSSTTL